MDLNRASFLLGVAAVATGSGAIPAHAQTDRTPPVEVRMASTALEERGKAQLERLLGTLPLEKWLFTRTVQIQARVIPHSHPVLTLSTQHLENDTAQVATFIHEQLHWFLETPMTDSAIADLRRIHPKVPAGPPDGARDEYSTYLHLLVCLLEFDGTAELFGEPVARRVLGGWRHYGWIYGEVLERPEPIRRILEARGLARPDARIRR
jgi:hypothetical protein